MLPTRSRDAGIGMAEENRRLGHRGIQRASTGACASLDRALVRSSPASTPSVGWRNRCSSESGSYQTTCVDQLQRLTSLRLLEFVKVSRYLRTEPDRGAGAARDGGHYFSSPVHDHYLVRSLVGLAIQAQLIIDA